MEFLEEKQRDLNDTLRMAMDAYTNAKSFMNVGLYIYGPIIKVDKKSTHQLFHQ